MAASYFCAIIKKIQDDPFKKVEGLTVKIFSELQEHLKVCIECSNTVDSICERYKNVSVDPNSEWNKTKYN